MVKKILQVLDNLPANIQIITLVIKTLHPQKREEII